MRWIFSAALALLVACSPPGGSGGGSGPIPTPPAQDWSWGFVGTWYGTMSGWSGGEASGSDAAVVVVDRSAENRLTLVGLCPDATAVDAEVTGPATFTVNGATCPPHAATGCPFVTLRWTGGSGIGGLGTLAVAIDGAVSGCGQDAGIELLFTGAPQAPPAVLTSVDPDRAPVGAPRTLVVLGWNFVPGAAVEWNGSARPTTFYSGGELQAQLTAADVGTAGTFEVTVTNPGAARSNPVLVTLLAPAPVLASLDPAGAIVGGPGLVLHVLGTDFAPGATVTWNGSPRPTTVLSEGEATALIAADDLAESGTVTVAATNPGSDPSNGLPLLVSNPAPALTAVAPDAAIFGSAAPTLALTGSGFVPASAGTWDGYPRPTVRRSETTLEVSLSVTDVASLGSHAVSVVNPAPGGGTSASLTVNVVYGAPTPSAISPARVEPGAGRLMLTVLGAGFVDASTVLWKGEPRPTTRPSEGVLHAALTAADVQDAGTATVSVRTPAPGGGVAVAGTVTIAPAASPSQAVAYQLDAAHTGRTAFGVPHVVPTAPIWTVNLPDLVSYPVIAEGRVFLIVRGISGGYGVRLIALDLATGAVLWGPRELSGTYYWSGHVFERGKLFVLNFDGLLRSFDAATGAPGWSVQLPGQYAFSASPSAKDGVVYAGGAGIGGTVYAVDAGSGAVLWTASVMNGDQSSPAVGPDGLVVAYPCQVYKLDLLTGTAIWRFSGPCEGGGGSTVAYGHGAAYVRDWTRLVPPFSVYDGFDGALLGTIDVAGATIPSVGPAGTFYSAGGALVATDALGGATSWTFSEGGIATAPIVVDDEVIVGSSAGTVYGLDAGTGAVRWSGPAGAPVPGPVEDVSRPPTGLAAADGWLVVPAGNVVTGWRLVGP